MEFLRTRRQLEFHLKCSLRSVSLARTTITLIDNDSAESKLFGLISSHSDAEVTTRNSAHLIPGSLLLVSG